MFIKYPRTCHLEGSRLQQGDTDYDQIPVSILTTGELVWEEKIDGANCGISFDENSNMILQCRGHVLTGGHRENQFNQFKTWAAANLDDFYCILGTRYIMYGEWCFAKHSVFYDALPHYFLEFDIFDKVNNVWLGTDARHKLLIELPIISVPVIHRGYIQNRKGIENLIRPSLYKTANWKQSLISQASKYNIDPNKSLSETDNSDMAEGLYLKQELNGIVIGRYKFVRYDFVQTIIESGTHWADRPILPNMLIEGFDIFSNIVT